MNIHVKQVEVRELIITHSIFLFSFLETNIMSSKTSFMVKSLFVVCHSIYELHYPLGGGGEVGGTNLVYMRSWVALLLIVRCF